MSLYEEMSDDELSVSVLEEAHKIEMAAIAEQSRLRRTASRHACIRFLTTTAVRWDSTVFRDAVEAAKAIR